MTNPSNRSGGQGGASTPVPPRGAKKGRQNASKGGDGAATRQRPAAGGRPQGAKGRQARQAAQRRNRMIAILSVVVVLAVVAVVVILGVSSGSGSTPRKPATPQAVQAVTSIPISTLTAASSQFGGLVPAQPAAGGALTSGGKPELLYIGAEFCPYCAAERWPMVIALSKFGTFSNLQTTRSATTDMDIGTWSFYGSTYTSQYLSFASYEEYTNERKGSGYKPLETVPGPANQVWAATEANTANGQGFPFLDFAGKYTIRTAQFDPTLIQSRSFDSILGVVGKNDNTVGADIDASAAMFTKYLCGITNNQPGSVCSAVANVPAPVVNSGTGSGSPSSSGNG